MIVLLNNCSIIVLSGGTRFWILLLKYDWTVHSSSDVHSLLHLSLDHLPLDALKNRCNYASNISTWSSFLTEVRLLILGEADNLLREGTHCYKVHEGYWRVRGYWRGFQNLNVCVKVWRGWSHSSRENTYCDSFFTLNNIFLCINFRTFEHF